MDSPSLKFLVQNYQMKQHHKSYYRELEGYLVTVSEGNTHINIMVSVTFPDMSTYTRLKEMLQDKALRKEYHLYNHNVTEKTVQIGVDYGLNKKMRGVVAMEWLLRTLRELGVRGVEICSVCGQPLALEDRADTMISDCAVAMHSSCASRMQTSVVDQEQREKEQPTNLGRGLLGAVIGGVLGALPWAIFYALGYFVAWCGLIIGWGALKGYTRAGGRVRRITIPFLLVIIVLCVLLGQVMGDALQLAYGIFTGELAPFTYGDIPSMLDLVYGMSDYRPQFIGNFLMGLLFAGLGVFGLIRQMLEETKSAAEQFVRL